ncbi:signal peptidase II [Streptococcus pseudoporcinus]|uniref:Lipoprotein signal peptidase n=2 Tax=Streptococcus pseudoporcinus TaxID=361101 RepID=G5K6W0_9STRE|nr:signal peptidase II [Streptococcus pseudoporcinus]EFR44251.1 signal peptidase II [Streptococcus pseudoporcinus SPIN 20026]EHI65881.1 signal peptidase II [Streptococcus pseudoporcinus LQ 940-04]VEF94656.1 lipoprotein signal peptidase [Streptococcus pseudoporcinus]VTS13795.1 lipoprotein signal peptidase [Streptococcus pseudoporcinus]VUC66806.1 lipoprotein signal peptidase [Streptococcus pseudoporcinus]
MKFIKLLLVSSGLIILDQVSKWWIVGHIALGDVRPFIPGVLSLTYLQNRGAAFSILQNQQWFFALMTIVVIGFAIVYYLRAKKMPILKEFALILIISGGIGNFSDRLRLGYVVDMIHLDFMNFAIFNLADSYLSLGVLMLVLILWKED